LVLTPPFYEQFVEVRRQQFAQQEQARSREFDKWIADLNASVAEWRDWRQQHPGLGTMAALRVHAKWLVPLIVSVANPTLLVQPWFFSVLAADGKAKVAEDIYGHWRVRIAVRKITNDGGVKRRG
jgi:hypothetical protein